MTNRASGLLTVVVLVLGYMFVSFSTEPRRLFAASPLSPAISFATYLGGSGSEHIRDVATDMSGNIYIAGGFEVSGTSSFPFTHAIVNDDARQRDSRSRAKNFDAFVTKLDPGGQIVWSTRIGGPNRDRAYALEVNDQGQVIVAGRAGYGFPTTIGALVRDFPGGDSSGFYGRQAGFLLKLAADGQKLLWSTYFGSDDGEATVRDLDIDEQGNVYIAAVTKGGAYDTKVAAAFLNSYRGGSSDAVAAKISSDGGRVHWARYLGGSGTEGGENTIRFGNGKVYFLTHSNSSDAHIGAPASFNTTNAGGFDLLAVKMDATSGAVEYAGYFGGSADETAETHQAVVALDGSFYISAQDALSSDIRMTPGALQTDFGGTGGIIGDAVIATISADGRRILAATYFGGNGRDAFEGIAIDLHGNIVLSGFTGSANLPVSRNSIQGTFAGGRYDGFILVLDPNLTRVVYSTYYGGAGEDRFRAVATDSQGNIISGGFTGSSNLNVPKATQPNLRGAQDALLLKITPYERKAPP